MALNQNTEVMLHGVGVSQLVYTNGTILRIKSSQDVEIKTSATSGDIRGGDSFYAKLNYIKEKGGDISITNAVMTLADLKAVTGDNISVGAEVLVPEDTKTVTAGACQLTQTANVIVADVYCQKADGTALTRIASGTPTATQFLVTTAGVVTVDATLNDTELTFSYYYTDSTGLAIHALENSVPGNCELRHKITTDEMPDGNRYVLDIRVYKCKATGSYDYSAKMGDAYAPKLEFKVLDAGRADGRTLTYSVSKYVA
jgi:hypothetical protein